MSLETLFSPLVLFGISTLCWWLILTPISVYYLLYYYRHRNNVSIKHRHWQIVLLLGAFCIFFWSIERPLELMWKIQELNLNDHTLNVLQNTHYILFPITIHGFVWCIVWRYYMIMYNIKFYEENINMKWKIIINYNMNIKNKNVNWFLFHKNKYGSIQWLLPRIAFIFTLVMTLLIISQFYHQLLASILDCVISFFSIPILFILWCKTPIIDHFHIGKEYIYITVLCSIEWCFYFGGSLIHMLVFADTPITYTAKYNTEITFIFIQSWSAILFAFSVVIICTKWTLYKCNIYKVDAVVLSVRSLRSLSAIGSNSEMINNRRKISAISPRGKTLKLYECLQCNHGFNCFMNHLMSEFSHECLLSIIEMVQWKKCLSYSYTDVLGANQLCLPSSLAHKLSISASSTMEESPSHSSLSPQQSPPIVITTQTMLSSQTSISDSLNSITSRHEILTCQFPACVAKSYIVFRSNIKGGHPQVLTKESVLREYRIKACQLFEKYIYDKSGQCQYEINISYNQRKKLIHLMGDKAVWTEDKMGKYGFEHLYTLFDNCILEMYDLMCHSFQRFKKTPQFAKLDRKIFCKSSFPDTFGN